jgi:hypothetical protein
MHLHGTTGVNGCVLVARDGAIGLVEDFIVDTRYWVIRYLDIGTRNGQPGRHVLVSPGWIERVSWEDRVMNVDLTSTAIHSAPGFDSSRGITRDNEIRLFEHYGRRLYWQRHSGTN